MTGFLLELESYQTVEWRDKYIQFKILAQLLTALNPKLDSIQTKLIAKRQFSLLGLTSPLNLHKYHTNTSSAVAIHAEVPIIIDNHITTYTNNTTNNNTTNNNTNNMIIDSTSTSTTTTTTTTNDINTNTNSNPQQSIPTPSPTLPTIQPTSLQLQPTQLQPLPLTTRQTILDTIDEHDELENEEHLAQLTPGLQQIQQEQAESVGMNQLNSISQINSFSKELREKRQQLLQQQLLQRQIITHKLTTQTSLNKTTLSRQPSNQNSLYHSNHSNSTHETPIKTTNSIKGNNKTPSEKLNQNNNTTTNNNTNNNQNDKNIHNNNNTINTSDDADIIIPVIIPMPNVRIRGGSISLISPVESKYNHNTNNNDNNNDDDNDDDDKNETTSLINGQISNNATTTNKNIPPKNINNSINRPSSGGIGQSYTPSIRSIRSGRSSILNGLTKTIAHVATTRRRLTKAEYLSKKYSNSAMTPDLRQSLIGTPYENYNIEDFYQTRGNYSVTMNRNLQLNLTNNQTQILNSTHQIRQALTTQFNTKNNNNNNNNDDTQINNTNLQLQQSQDDGEYYWDEDLLSLVSDGNGNNNYNINTNKKMDDTVIPNYTSHRIAQLEITPIQDTSRKNKKWLDYFKLKTFIGNQNNNNNNNNNNNGNNTTTSNNNRNGIKQLNQSFYNRLIHKLEKYGCDNTSPLCRPRKYYECLKELCLYLHTIQRDDLLPNLPQLKNPLEILHELYPLQLRNREEIELEIHQQLPIFNTFLPVNCIRYHVEVLFCNSIQNELVKINEFTLLLEEYYDSHLFHIASILSQLQYSEILLQQCLVDPKHSQSINIYQFIKMRNIQIEKIKKTLSEIYRGLIYLEQYQLINLRGFTKILKKHDKISLSFPFSRQVLLPLIFSSHFAQSSAGIYMKKFVEGFFQQIYPDWKIQIIHLHSLASINTSSTNTQLSITSSSSPSSSLLNNYSGNPISITNWLRLGAYGGMMFLFIVSNLLLYFFYPKAAFESVNFDVGFPIFRVLMYIVVTCWMWSFVTLFCEKARFNYQLILQLNPQTYLRPPQLFELSSLLTVLFMACFTGFVFTLSIDQEDVIHHYVLYSTLLLFIALLINPFNFLYRPSRYYLIKNVIFFFLAPFTPATINITILGNVVSSLSSMIQDLTYVSCYYIKYPITHVPPPIDAISVCKSIIRTQYWFVPGIPQVSRGLQNLRSTYYTGEWYPYSASMMKYFIIIPETISKYYMRAHNYILFYVIIYSFWACLRGLWSFIWDVSMDFKIPARLQATTDKYEQVITHLNEQDQTLLHNHIDVTLPQHKEYFFARYAAKGNKVEDEYNKVVTNYYAGIQSQHNFSPILNEMNNDNIYSINSQQYFNQTSPIFNNDIQQQQSQQLQQQQSYNNNNNNNNNNNTNNSINSSYLISTITETDTMLNPSSYFQLDSNQTPYHTSISSSTTTSCCPQFRYYMHYHNNIIHFKPITPYKYCCCGPINYSKLPKDIDNNLPTSYSKCGLALWYFIYMWLLLPFKAFLGIIYYPIFYLFVFFAFIFTCVPCRSIYRHSIFLCKHQFPKTCGTTRQRTVDSITRKYWQIHKPTPYLYQTIPSFPTFYLPGEFLRMFFYHPLKFYSLCIIIDLIFRNTWVWGISPNIPTILHISSDWLSFIIGISSILRRGLWIYLRFESEQLKLTNKLQAINLEGELIGFEYGWARRRKNDDNDDDLPPVQRPQTQTQLQQQQQQQQQQTQFNNKYGGNNTNNNIQGTELSDLNSNNNDIDNDHGNNETNMNSNTNDDYDYDNNITTTYDTNDNIIPTHSNTIYPTLDAAMQITKLITTGDVHLTPTTMYDDTIQDFLETDEIIVDPIHQARIDFNMLLQQTPQNPKIFNNPTRQIGVQSLFKQQQPLNRRGTISNNNYNGSNNNDDNDNNNTIMNNNINNSIDYLDDDNFTAYLVDNNITGSNVQLSTIKSTNNPSTKIELSTQLLSNQDLSSSPGGGNGNDNQLDDYGSQYY